MTECTFCHGEGCASCVDVTWADFTWVELTDEQITALDAMMDAQMEESNADDHRAAQ